MSSNEAELSQDSSQEDDDAEIEHDSLSQASVQSGEQFLRQRSGIKRAETRTERTLLMVTETKQYTNRSDVDSEKLRRKPLKRSDSASDSDAAYNYTAWLWALVMIPCGIVLLYLLFGAMLPRSETPDSSAKDRARNFVKQLATEFPNQSRSTVRKFHAELFRLLESPEDEPACLLIFQYNCSAGYSMDKFISRLAETAFLSLDESKSGYFDVEAIALQMGEIAAEDFHRRIRQVAARSKVVLVRDVDRLSLSDVKSQHRFMSTLHAMCDNTQAPFKDRMIISTVSISAQEFPIPPQVQESMSERSDHLVNEFLVKKWTKNPAAQSLSNGVSGISDDEIYPVVTRLAKTSAYYRC